MSKPLAASKKVMKNYLSELLTDEPIVIEQIADSPKGIKDKSRVEALLKNVNADLDVAPHEITTHKSLVLPPHFIKEEFAPSENSGQLKQQSEAMLTTQKSHGNNLISPPKSYRQGDFQALFFNVAGLTLAVPLIELGGIHNVDKITSLMGKPNWFKGVMLHRSEKINVVDTALWVMPEKYDETLKNSLNYQYIIMLNNSPWGLMAENLVDTVVLKQDEVKWLDSPSKRPWLAGLVKDKMCALLDIEALIALLNEGSGINQFD